VFLNTLKHIAIIPDGNNRWGERNGVSAIGAYTEGANTVEKIVMHVQELGIPYITMYMISLENVQKRSSAWRSMFFKFLENTLDKSLKEKRLPNVRILTIGDLSALPENITKKIREIVASTANNSGTTLIAAVAYPGRDEIARAVTSLLKSLNLGAVEAVDAINAITPDMLEKHLDTAGIPFPDLLIRTSGEMRLSGFLLWQLAYTELLFVDELWPDFSVGRLDEAVAAFHKRTRNFGKDRGCGN
jgi:undecaprenyl diphosphate synthase